MTEQTTQPKNSYGPGEAPRWEVINAGIPATDTWQREILLHRSLESIHPHVVVLAFYVNHVAPRYSPRKDAESGLTNSWTKRFTYLLKRSSLVTWMYYGVLLPWEARRKGAGLTEDAVITGQHNDDAERG